MSALSLRLPKSLHEQLKELAQEEGISVNQFVMLAVAEKVASISTIEYLEKRANRGSREKLLAVLNKVPDVEPASYDKFPSDNRALSIGEDKTNNLYSANKVAFLLGSGSSIAVGMPGMAAITDQVLSGKGVYRHTDGHYFIYKSDNNQYKQLIARIVSFLGILSAEIRDYYNEKGKNKREVNYEDLYYIADQIRGSESCDYDNPIIKALIDRIGPKTQPLISEIEGIESIGDGNNNLKLEMFAKEITAYISDIVYRMLVKKPRKLDRLNCIKNACLDKEFSHVDIFTLNHDIVMEAFLRKEKIGFTDGFDKPSNGVRYWKPELYENSPNSVCLFKLHGSIDWFEYRRDPQETRKFPLIGIPPDWDAYHTLDRNGNMQWPEKRGYPIMLLGTINKMLEYTKTIFADLYSEFCQRLRSTSNLIIVGYGFGDDGINTRIIEWMDYAPDNKIVLIDPNPDVSRGARGIMRWYLRNWSKSKLVIVSKGNVPVGIENTSWDMVKEILFKNPE